MSLMLVYSAWDIKWILQIWYFVFALSAQEYPEFNRTIIYITVTID